MKLLVGLLFLLVICVAWPIVDAGDYFELGRNPEQPRLLPNSLSVKQKNSRLPVIERDVDLQQIEFKSSWVVEFNDLIISSLEDFKEYHNVHLRQIGKTNKFAIRQKVASLGRDSKKRYNRKNWDFYSFYSFKILNLWHDIILILCMII